MATYEAAIADVDRNLVVASKRLDRAEQAGDYDIVATCQATVDSLLDARADLMRASGAA